MFYDVFTYALQERRKWIELGKSLPMTLQWKDLKEGEHYHIPPIMSMKRRDFKIIRINPTYLRIAMNGKTKNVSDYDYIYNYDVQANFIVKN